MSARVLTSCLSPAGARACLPRSSLAVPHITPLAQSPQRTGQGHPLGRDLSGFTTGTVKLRRGGSTGLDDGRGSKRSEDGGLLSESGFWDSLDGSEGSEDGGHGEREGGRGGIETSSVRDRQTNNDRGRIPRRSEGTGGGEVRIGVIVCIGVWCSALLQCGTGL
jgi:hypothetical protein